MCVALNIISGYPDGSFKPEGNITRAEFTKMLCVLLNGGNTPATATKATPTFSDIRTSANASWAEGFIEYCYAKGIVSGVGDGKFNPNGNITGTEAAKMLLVALGYNASVEGYTGAAWALKVNVQANQDGLYDDLKGIDTNAALTRDNAAQMIWNALKAKMIEKNSSIDRTDGSITDIYSKGKDTMLKDKFNAVDDQSAQMVGFTYNSDKEEWTYYFSNKSTVAAQDEKDGNLGFTKFTSSTDYTDLYMQNVKVVYTLKSGSNAVDKVFGMYADDTKVLSSSYVGDFDDLGKIAANADEVTINDVDYDIEGTAVVYTFQNGTTSAAADEALNTALVQANAAFVIDAIDYDDNGDIDFFVIHKFEVNQIASVGSKNFTLENATVAGKTSFKFDDVVSYKDMAEDDFVVYTPKAYSVTNDDTFAKVDTVLKGKVTAYKSTTEFAVDGTWYESVKALDVKSGGNIKDAPVVNGYVFQASTTGTKDVSEYAMIVSIASSDKNGINGAQAKLLFNDGTKKVVDLDQNYNYQPGWFVTYEVNSDDEYELTIAISKQDPDNLKQQSGFDQVVNMSALLSSDMKDGSYKIKYINGWNIADDAVIFVNDNGDYKVITGAQLKTISGANLSQVIAYANENSTSGYNTVEMAKVVFNKDSVSADDTYGFVVATPVQVQNADNKTVTELKIWTDEGKEVTLNTKAGKTFDTVKKGSIISFSVNEKNEIDKLSVETTVGSSVNSAGTTVANSTATKYISAYDGTYIVLNDDGNRHEITKDTVIVYIDADKSAGSDNGSIKKATKTGKDTGAEYYNNVYVIFDGSAATADVDTIFVDINNDIDDLM